LAAHEKLESAMILKIDANSSKPVYQQIIDQVKYAVASGQLRADDRLPPIREVAVQTRVNRNTVSRAYMELEREGVIRSRAGQGSFVSAEGAGIGRARAKKMLGEKIDELLSEARRFQLGSDDLLALVQERLSKVKLDDND
jgi:GntR family transcriptional regulator